MKKTTKILIGIASILTAAVAVFFLAPLKAWKKGTGITLIEKEKKSDAQIATFVADQYMRIPLTYTPNNSKYLLYCIIWWKAYFGTQATYTSPDHTYDGGELEEITVTPKTK